MRAALLETDQETRIASMDHEEFAEYGQNIDAAIGALHRQLPMGNVEPMRDSTRIFLVGHGYQPDFSPADWREIAYVMTQATLHAYEDMATRQQGAVLEAPTDADLPSQYELQNVPKAATAAQEASVT